MAARTSSASCALEVAFGIRVDVDEIAAKGVGDVVERGCAGDAGRTDEHGQGGDERGGEQPRHGFTVPGRAYRAPVPTSVTATEFAARDDLPDWRYLVGGIHAHFRAGSFDAAVHLVQEIAAAAAVADHHPDVDLRYPDRVQVALSTHAVGDLTDRDLAMAAQISELASRAGATTEPLLPQRTEVAIDAMDVDAVLPFWRAVLGYVDDVPPGYEGQVVAIRDPARIGPPFWFQQMDEPRSQRNRFHIDVVVPHDTAERRIADALAAGGHIVTDQYARSWWVLADVEGNEACVCTWQDRD